MQSTPSLPSLLGPFWIWVVAPDRVLSMSQIEQFDHLTVFKQMTFLIELLVILSNTWNRLTVCKQMSNVEKNYLF